MARGILTIPLSEPLALGRSVRAPRQWDAFLGRSGMAWGEPAAAELDESLWRRLEAVNRDINRRVRYRRERKDYWRVARRAGDCEDIALRKAVELAEELPLGALRPTLCITPEREGHALLAVVTDLGVYWLDNMTDAVLTTPACPHRLLSVWNGPRWAVLPRRKARPGTAGAPPAG